MTTERTILRPIPASGACPMDVAEACYIKWGSRVPFVTDLADYLRTGVVIARPDIFGMAKIIDIADVDNQTTGPQDNRTTRTGQQDHRQQDNRTCGQPEPAWFIRIAVGDLASLLAALPCYLPTICFCRRGKETMKEYSLMRLVALAGRLKIGDRRSGDDLPSASSYLPSTSGGLI